MPPSEQISSKALSGKEPWLAVNLSMLWPGIGQIYSGQVLRGCIFIIIQLLLSCLGGWLIFSPTGNLGIGSIFLLGSVLFIVLTFFDAYRCAKKANSLSF